MANKVIPSTDKNWIMKLSIEKKRNVMHSMLTQNAIGIFVEFAKILTSEHERRGGMSKEDINKMYSEYHPGETLQL